MPQKEIKNTSNKGYNRLIHEKSPYLLQHAYNPVDWYPWGEEAFKKAKAEDKPIFLSIGYSTCHWCHVMAHESFEDPEVAKLMNNTFVSIKVDREERPDIDNVYMLACQAITGSGGWPLTIIMTPDKKPFFAGTYIPKTTRFNQVGMLQLVPNIKELWINRKFEVESSADEITFALKQLKETAHSKNLDKNILTGAYKHFGRRFDDEYGGFGSAPKFPTPHNLMFLLRYWRRKGDEKALDMVEKTLNNMRRGGLFDHLGFGFHRYSTDRVWLVPHFEKMLYDQALLTIAYIEAFQATGKAKYREVAKEIITYVLRDMTAPGGGFYSAEDADSEGEEGKFYIWTKDKLKKILTKKEFEIVNLVYNIKVSGNYIDQITGKTTGANILHLTKPISALADELQIQKDELKSRLKTVREKLFKEREKREKPHKDDKILTDWNGLMVAALAKSGQAVDNSEYIISARDAVKFVLENLRNAEGRLMHRFRAGEAAIEANINDYTFLIWGLIELYEATFDTKYLDNAVDLNKELLDHFWDNQGGGFYFTADDAEELLLRQKEIYDGAIPSGNAVAFLNLLRLSRLTNEPALEAKAAQLVQVFSSTIGNNPAAHTQFLVGFDFTLGPSYEVLVEGKPEAAGTKNMINALRTNFLPNKIVHLNSKYKPKKDLFRLPVPGGKGKMAKDETIAYICVNYSCQKPTSDVDEMLRLLGIN
ncbi:thioredoxin domain-containing protein [[Eubacterium] cellulosolvens]